MNKRLIKYACYLKKWAEKKQFEANADGLIFGLSGGVDSALVLSILSKNNSNNIYGVFIDIYNTTLDKNCVSELKNKFNFKYIYVNLEKEFELIKTNLKLTNQNAINNLKVRLRMITLYALAAQYNSLVVGTTNADERITGYFTKFGDGACDISLLTRLLKSQIFQLAKIYDIPKIIIDRKPSASLYEGQSDEVDMGLFYNEIDNYLLFKKIDKSSKKKIIDMSNRNKHKLSKFFEPKKLSFIKR